MNTALIVTLVVGVIGPLAAYFGIVRRASGKIGTSEAEQLWEESRAIREWATKRIGELEAKVERLEREHEDCQAENIKLLRRIGQLLKRIRELEQAA